LNGKNAIFCKTIERQKHHFMQNNWMATMPIFCWKSIERQKRHFLPNNWTAKTPIDFQSMRGCHFYHDTCQDAFLPWCMSYSKTFFTMTNVRMLRCWRGPCS
jgi:hypothetical protein